MSSKAEAHLKPWCPFCGMDIGRPTDGAQRKMREFPMGVCECGAVYVAEATGHNIGAAMVECLVSACNEQWDLAWDLVPEEDYLTGTLDDYDDVTHQVVAKRNLDGRAVRGVLYFVRLHKDVAELVKRYEQKQGGGAPHPKAVGGEAGQSAVSQPGIELPRDPKRLRKRADKQVVKQLAQCADIDALVDLYLDDPKALRYLQRLLYEPDPVARYRIAWVIGQVCGRIAVRQPGPVADMLHRLFGACSDSAASSWGMVETIGAIIASRPDVFGAFTRHLFDFMGDPGTREAVLWGLGEIAANRPDLVRKTPFYSLFPLLNHSDPMLRGLTLRLLGRIKAQEAGFQIMALQNDEIPVTICEQGNSLATTVAELSAQATRQIHKEEGNGE
ncbi:MAG: PBS lyase [Desulfobulbaceae bacterium]|nr:PBS lyase [Desulfobulbaceae bacterium]